MDKNTIPAVKTLMTAFPLHIDGQMPIAEAGQLMNEKQVHHLVITRDDGSFGLLSERDLQHHRVIYGGKSNDGLVINDICSEDAICADINDPLDKVLDAMAKRHLGSVVILREAELAGIFTTTDACHHFAEHLRQQQSSASNPDLIA